MERRAPYVLIGAAMILFVAAVAGFVVWKLRAGDRTAYAYYNILFSGDVIYDGDLAYDNSDSDIADYVRSAERVRELPVRIVHGGHFASFGRARLVELPITRSRKPGAMRNSSSVSAR